MHPRVSLSELCSWNWTLDEDLAFYEQAGITTIGASLAKLRGGGLEAGRLPHPRRGAAGREPHRRRPVPARRPRRGGRSSADRVRARRSRPPQILDAECLVLTTGPAGPLTWEDAADEYAEAMEPIIAESTRIGVRDRGRAHELVARRRRVPAQPPRRGRPRPPSRRRACASRPTRAGPSAASRRRSHAGVDTFRLVQVSDFGVGTLSTPNRLVPGDGDIPFDARARLRARRRLRRGCSTSSSSDRRSRRRATPSACRRRRRQPRRDPRLPRRVNAPGTRRRARCQSDRADVEATRSASVALARRRATG